MQMMNWTARELNKLTKNKTSATHEHHTIIIIIKIIGTVSNSIIIMIIGRNTRITKGNTPWFSRRSHWKFIKSLYFGNHPSKNVLFDSVRRKHSANFLQNWLILNSGWCMHKCFWLQNLILIENDCFDFFVAT